MATLTVKVVETITLNGKEQGGLYSGFTNANITQVRKQLLTCIAGTEYTLYQTDDDVTDSGFGGTGASFFDEDSVKYVRITNLGTAGHHGFLHIYNNNATPDEVSVRLEGKESFLLYGHSDSLNAIDAAAAQVSVAT